MPAGGADAAGIDRDGTGAGGDETGVCAVATPVAAPSDRRRARLAAFRELVNRQLRSNPAPVTDRVQQPVVSWSRS
jgi:hypothetical protein